MVTFGGRFTQLALTLQIIRSKFGWRESCDAKPDELDDIHAHLRTHEKSDFLLMSFDPGIVWDEYGIRSDVVPFTHDFPRADIHEVISPDLLHQLIKGTFKDHLVTWVNDYFRITLGKAQALRTIQDVDRRISAVPSYPGLRRFPDGRDFNQWTGSDSRALMKVYLAAIVGHVPPQMIRCISAFMNCCYIARRNAISTSDITRFKIHLSTFHESRHIFIKTGVRTDISLPRQHSLMHYADGIELFGSPNGLCTSITEAKHIPVIKEPWRRSSHNQPLPQMLTTISRMEQLAAIKAVFRQRGMLDGKLRDYMVAYLQGSLPSLAPFYGPTLAFRDDTVSLTLDSVDTQDKSADIDDDASSPISGPRVNTEISLAQRHCTDYPYELQALSDYIRQPDFPAALLEFIQERNHPGSQVTTPVLTPDSVVGRINVYHSAAAEYYSPSDSCGSGGMYREIIRANPRFNSEPRFDTVLVSVGDTTDPMHGLMVARVRLFFSYYDAYTTETIPCALVSWFVHPSETPSPDSDTGMWIVQPEIDVDGTYPVQVIHLDSILRGIHLLPCFGKGIIPEDFLYIHALDAFNQYYVNHFVDYHAHELLAD
ncbi:hypothetical protein ONZ45_g12596 [Pleurotus djamor]|nr:hypothetical protein ONZ45_g12596 [Pleurotus djamor]